MSIKKILFPTDMTAGSDAASKLAIALARQCGAEMLFFHAVLTHADDLRQIGAPLSDLFEKLEAQAHRELERETSELRENGMVVRSEVSQEPAAFDAILARATVWKPDLIVMATHGRTGMPRWFLGSVAEKLVRHAPCAVATLRPDGQASTTGDRLERILVPVDFSDNARRALDWARELASDEGTIILHHVVHNPTLAGFASAERLRLFSVEPTLPEKIREEMDVWMNGQPFESEITEADDVVASVIGVAEAKRAQLIVVGARGQSGFEHFLTGSVADKLVRSSRLPVVTVR